MISLKARLSGLVEQWRKSATFLSHPCDCEQCDRALQCADDLASLLSELEQQEQENN